AVVKESLAQARQRRERHAPNQEQRPQPGRRAKWDFSGRQRPEGTLAFVLFQVEVVVPNHAGAVEATRRREKQDEWKPALRQGARGQGAETDVGQGRRQVRQTHELSVGGKTAHKRDAISVMRCKANRAAWSGSST